MELTVTNQKKASITAGMIGLFIEDINYALDGGLSAEMIENRSFETLDVSGGKNEDYYTVPDGLYGWTAYPGADGVSLICVAGSPVNENNPHYLRITTQQAGKGVSNQAYEGIFLNPELTYKVSFYARATDYVGSIKAAIVKDNVEIVSEEVKLKTVDPSAGRNWEFYQLTLKPHTAVEHALFTLQLMEAGTVEFDFVSMIPSDAVDGIFRKDLVESLKELTPGFLRFPGGCVVEGNTLANRYRFKNTLGPIEGRKHNWNRWAVHMNGTDNGYHSRYSHYNQTLAIGYYEYFLLCEEIEAKPLPVVNVGLACQYQTHELVEVTDPAFQEFLQDALDLIEFANGGEDTVWGAVRCQMGHPEPFGMDMIGIGNEQWETEHVDFYHRYELFEQAIHAAYPKMKLIGSAGPELNSERYQKAWNFYRMAAKTNPDAAYAVDEHYYIKPEWFLQHTDYYDNYPREVKVFFGEYAAHPEGVGGRMNRMDANTLEGALSEAAFLTGIERNSDVVVLASYAPLLARYGYSQWSPDLIWFDAKKVCRTPSYYVQKLYANHLGTVNLSASGEEEGIYYNVSYQEETGEVILKVVNMNSEIKNLNLSWDGMTPITTMAKVSILKGESIKDYNTLEEEKVTCQELRYDLKDGCFPLGNESFTVIRIPMKMN